MTLPVEGAKGYIEALDDEVLGVVDLNNPYSEVKLEAKIIPISEEQNWHRGNANENGWFLLKNPHTGKVLTKVGNSYTTIDGNIICTLKSKLSCQLLYWMPVRMSISINRLEPPCGMSTSKLLVN